MLVQGMINSYNQLVLDRNRILKSAGQSISSKMDQEITSLKSNVQEVCKDAVQFKYSKKKPK
jgi:hypothetical protein